MECNKDEALRAKAIAEKKLTEGDVPGAKKFATKAQSLFPDLDGISQFLEVIDFYATSQKKIDGEFDWYGILGVDPSADEEALKRNYRKLALRLHPDKNNSVGAEGAFKILIQAWSVLSDKSKRMTYDLTCNPMPSPQKVSVGNLPTSTATDGFNNSEGIPSSVRHPANASRLRRGPGRARAQASSSYSGNNSTAPYPRNPTPTTSHQYPLVPPYPGNPSTSTGFRYAPYMRNPTPPTTNPQPTPATANPWPSPATMNPGPASMLSQSNSDVFWTSCSKCTILYRYMRIYIDKKLLCLKCGNPFIAKLMPAQSSN